MQMTKENSMRFRRSNRVPRPRTVLPPYEMLYGWHSVVAALNNPKRRVLACFATANVCQKLSQMAFLHEVKPELVTTKEIARRIGDESCVHQGIYLECHPLGDVSFESLYTQSALVALDQISDPQNIGAILRSAAAFDVGGVVTTVRHTPIRSAVMAKAASGGLERIALARVGNLSSALEMLNLEGFTSIGLDAQAELTLDRIAPSLSRYVLVVGAEGKGLRAKTKETCSVLARIPTPSTFNVLNVSNSVAVALYALHTGMHKAEGTPEQ